MIIKRILRIALSILSLVMMAWFIAPAFWGIWHIGCVVGILLCAAVFFRTALAPLYRKIKDALCKKKATKVLLRTVQIFSVIVVIYCSVASAFMVYAMIQFRNEPRSTAVVLGAQVMSWGPSPILRERVEAAEDYLNENPLSLAVVSGGKGSGEPMSEADCMYELMIEDGIEPDRIFREDQSKNTDENIRNSLAIIKEKGLNQYIAVVTDSYHQARARIIIRKYDSNIPVTPVNTALNRVVPVVSYPSYFVREWLAIPVELLK